MRTDVSLAERAEQRVYERVQQRIGVRMADKSFAMRYFHAAQDQLAPAAKAVRVKAMSDAVILCHK